MASGPNLAVPVRAEGVPPRVVLSMANVDFADRVVRHLHTHPAVLLIERIPDGSYPRDGNVLWQVSRDAGSSNTYHQEVTLTNATRHPVPWELDDTPIKVSHCHMSPAVLWVWRCALSTNRAVCDTCGRLPSVFVCYRRPR